LFVCLFLSFFLSNNRSITWICMTNVWFEKIDHFLSDADRTTLNRSTFDVMVGSSGKKVDRRWHI
jgi:hypothetical protein